jgi:NDP-sugar pyrophosphorylase family protein
MSNTALILCGGIGSRLKPFTDVFPKPLIPIGGMPIMEILIRQLKIYGFSQLKLAVNHKSDMIKFYFGDGSKWDVEIEYLEEVSPLGTMGPLTLLNKLPENLLVLNADVLTNLNFRELLDFHIKLDSDFSIAGFIKKVKIDFGCLEFNEENKLIGFQEKPELPFSLSMGIYVIKKSTVDLIPNNCYYGFDDLMKYLLRLTSYSVRVFVHDSLWIDIGNATDYLKANSYFEENKNLFNF